VDAKSVSLSGIDVRKIAVPYESARFREIDARLLPLLVEQAKLNALGDFRKE